MLFLCSCISVLLVILFLRDEVLGTTALEGPLVAGLLLALVLFKVAGGVGRIFAGVYVFKDTFRLITGLEREVVEAEKKINKHNNSAISCQFYLYILEDFL